MNGYAYIYGGSEGKVTGKRKKKIKKYLSVLLPMKINRIEDDILKCPGGEKR